MFSRSIIDEDNGRELIIIFIILLKKDLWTWGHSTKKDQGGGMGTEGALFSRSMTDEDNDRGLIINFLLTKDLWTWGHFNKKDLWTRESR
jgi:hypothetical protein